MGKTGKTDSSDLDENKQNKGDSNDDGDNELDRVITRSLKKISESEPPTPHQALLDVNTSLDGLKSMKVFFPEDKDLDMSIENFEKAIRVITSSTPPEDPQLQRKYVQTAQEIAKRLNLIKSRKTYEITVKFTNRINQVWDQIEQLSGSVRTNFPKNELAQIGQISKSAVLLVKEGKLKEADNEITLLENSTKTGRENSERTSFEEEIDRLTNKLSTLQRHKCSEHVKTERADAERICLEANVKLEQGNYAEAMKLLQTASAKLDDGKKYADLYGEFKGKLADARRALNALALSGIDVSLCKATEKALTGAGKTADQREYDQARGQIDKAIEQVKDCLQKQYVDKLAKSLEHLKSLDKPHDVSTIIGGGGEIADNLLKSVKQRIESGEFALAVMDGKQLSALISRSRQLVQRQKAYNVRRGETMKAINVIEKIQLFQERAKELISRIVAADKLATASLPKFEDGIAILRDVDTECAALLNVKAKAQQFETEFKKAFQDYESLSKGEYAKEINWKIVRIRSLLNEAQKAVGSKETVF